MTLTALQGLPGSGKTTRAMELSQQTGAVLVTRDELRSRSKYLGRIIDELAAGNSVVADATNFTTITPLRTLAQSFNADFVIEFIDTPVEECIARDHQRSIGERTGARVIRHMYNDFLREQEEK